MQGLHPSQSLMPWCITVHPCFPAKMCFAGDKPLRHGTNRVIRHCNHDVYSVAPGYIAGVCTASRSSRLHERALDLSDIDSRINAGPDVHEDIRPQNPDVSSEAIHLHLASGNALPCSENSINNAFHKFSPQDYDVEASERHAYVLCVFCRNAKEYRKWLRSATAPE